jgi:hypothetical protein
MHLAPAADLAGIDCVVVAYFPPIGFAALLQPIICDVLLLELVGAIIVRFALPTLWVDSLSGATTATQACGSGTVWVSALITRQRLPKGVLRPEAVCRERETNARRPDELVPPGQATFHDFDPLDVVDMALNASAIDSLVQPNLIWESACTTAVDLTKLRIQCRLLLELEWAKPVRASIVRAPFSRTLAEVVECSALR